MNKFKLLLMFIFLSSLLLQQCCTSQEGIKDNNMKAKMKSIESLPYGMASLSMKILEVDESQSRLYCTATVETVHGYGNGVRPISKDTNYKFEFDSKLLDNVKSAIGKSVRGKVIQQTGGINAEPKISYKLISIYN